MHVAIAAAAQNRVWTHLLAVPLPQQRYNGIQLLWQENVAVATATATSC